METKVKSVFASKTLWINGIMAVLGVLAYANPEMMGIFGITPDNQAKVLPILASVTAILNMALRFLTTGEVSFTPTKDNAAK